MDDVRVGQVLRALRLRREWRQSDLAAAAGVSPSAVSLVERGHVDRTNLWTLRAISAALGATLELVARWRGADLDRILNANHARLHEAVATYLGGLDGWQHAPEVSFSIYGERGVIDILAFHPASRSLLVIELKTEIVSLEDLLTTMSRRARLALRIGAERGWEASAVSSWVVVAESDANRNRVRAFASTLRSALPADGHAIRRWLRRPVGGIAALSFWANGTGSGATQRTATRQRVRRASLAPGSPANATPAEHKPSKEPASAR